MNKSIRIGCLVLAIALLAGCACNSPSKEVLPSPSLEPMASTSPSPSNTGNDGVGTKINIEFTLPEQLKIAENGLPSVNVYVVDEEKVSQMDMETYLQGVLAGEMKNDWPIEALKAQAILARTFAVKFIMDKGGSKYEGADVSTDVEEAQAYDASGVDENIKKAIEETAGEILVHKGEPIYAWFHSHSGGVTAMAKEGLGYDEDEPTYIKSVEVEESPNAHKEAVSWEETFTLKEVQEALDKVGGGDASKLQIGEKGDSGRVVTFMAGDKEIPAPAFRLALGGTRMRSTMIDDLSVSDKGVTVSGTGYGHGVGMSQWAAYEMAEQGMKAEEIVKHFFNDVEVIKVWGEGVQ